MYTEPASQSQEIKGTNKYFLLSRTNIFFWYSFPEIKWWVLINCYDSETPFTLHFVDHASRYDPCKKPT